MIAVNAGLARALRSRGLWTTRLAALGTSAVIVAAAFGYGWLRPPWPTATSVVRVAQHLAMATFRAIETQRYLIPAANTGISAIVAPDGEIIQASALFTPAVLAGSVGPVVSRTPYVHYGDAFAWGAVVVSVLAVLLSIRARLPKGEKFRGRTGMRWSGLVESVGALVLLFVTASATAPWTTGGQQGDVAWRAAEDRRQQLIEDTQLQHKLWYLRHLQELRGAKESRLLGEPEEAEA